jgi:hypothetical protein
MTVTAIPWKAGAPKIAVLPSSIEPAAHGHPAVARWYFECESPPGAAVYFLQIEPITKSRG